MMVSRGAWFSATLVTAAISACSSSPSSPGLRVTRTPTGQAGIPGAAAGGPASIGNLGGPVGGMSSYVAPVMTGAAGEHLKDGECAGKELPTSRVQPIVWLVLDGSGSMDMALDGSEMTSATSPSRWNSLKDALMDPTMGVVKSLEHDLQWGMVMYDGPLMPAGGGIFGGGTQPSDGGTNECPRLVQVEPKFDNYNDIMAAYPANPLGGSTPTDKALDAVATRIGDSNGVMLDGHVNPTIVVLATDGAPNNFCADFPEFDVTPAVVSVVNKLTAANTKTYVISLAGNDQMLTQNLQMVASAGNTGKPPFAPTSKDELVQTFRDIIGPAASCDVALAGEVVKGNECKGTIMINGTTIPCGDPNGWVLKDSKTITIQGTACDDYKAKKDALLQASFPCEAIVLN